MLGECRTFRALAQRYGDDLAVVWIDSHPDVATPSSAYDGYHAMAVAVLTATATGIAWPSSRRPCPPQRVALAGLHNPAEDDLPNAGAWGITAFSPDDLREDSAGLLTWFAGTGAPRSPSTSTSTPSTAAKSSWAWWPRRAG